MTLDQLDQLGTAIDDAAWPVLIAWGLRILSRLVELWRHKP